MKTFVKFVSELMRIKWVSQIPNFTSFSGIIYQNGKSTLVHQSLFYFTNKIIYFRFLEIVVQEVLIINFRCHVFLKRTLVTVSGYESIQFITYVIGPPRYHLSEGRYRRGITMYKLQSFSWLYFIKSPSCTSLLFLVETKIEIGLSSY